MSQPSDPAPPAVTARLQATGPATLGHETNLARVPLWDVRARPLQLSLIAPTVLYGRQFRQVAGAALTVADQRLYAELTTRYIREGCPANRRVAFSLGEAARALGHASLGGETRRLVRQSLVRLKGVTIESALRDPDGHEELMGWGLLDWYRTTTRGGGRGWAALSEQIAYLIRRGSVTYLHAPTWDAIAGRDEIAGRLWSFLEAESLVTIRRYQLFASPPGTVAEERNLPAISELLRLDWAKRAEVAKRVRRALAVIADTDPRYQVALVKGKQLGMWRLEAARSGYLRSGPGGPLPAAVLAGWRVVYGARRPSKKQIAVLAELIERRGSAWVTGRLSAGYPDPLGALMALDQAQRRSDNEAIIARERSRDEERRADDTGFQRLGDLLQQLQSPRE